MKYLHVPIHLPNLLSPHSTYFGRPGLEWLRFLRNCHLEDRTPCHARRSQVCVVCVRRIGEHLRGIKGPMTQSYLCVLCLRLQTCHHDDVLMYVPGSSRFHCFSLMAPGSAVNCDGFASISSVNCIHGKYAGRRGQRRNGPLRFKVVVSN